MFSFFFLYFYLKRLKEILKLVEGKFHRLVFKLNLFLWWSKSICSFYILFSITTLEFSPVQIVSFLFHFFFLGCENKLVKLRFNNNICDNKLLKITHLDNFIDHLKLKVFELFFLTYTLNILHAGSQTGCSLNRWI